MARRINRRFVTILGGTVVAIVGGVFLTEKIVIHARPDQFISAARDAGNNGHWDDAVRYWQLAIGAAPDKEKPELLTALGEAYTSQANFDADAAARRLNIQTWQSALEIDPAYLPALNDLMNYWYGHAAEAPAQSYGSARDYAQTIIRLHPDDPQITDVRATLAKTTIEGWRYGVATDDATLNNAVSTLEDLMAKNPTEAEYPYYLAVVDVRRGQLLANASQGATQPAEATALFQKAADRMTAAAKSQDLPQMHFHAAIIDEQLGDIDHSTTDIRAQYRAAAANELDRAITLMKGTEPYFIEICIHAAQMAQFSGDDQKAHELARAIMKQRGSDPISLIQAEPIIVPFADLRPQAIATLKQAIDQEGQSKAIGARRFAFLAIVSDLQVGELSQAILDKADDKAKAAIRDSITDNIKLMQASDRSPDRTIQLQARLAAIQGQDIDVIQIITAGMDANPRVANDIDLRWMLAKAYYRTHERQPAIDNLQIVIARQPDFLDARHLLVRELADDNGPNARREIAQQLHYLQAAAPNLSWVKQLSILQMDPVQDADAIKAIYATLPETELDDIRMKSSIAISVIKDYNEASRLLEKAVAAAPDDVQVVVALVQAYVQSGQTAKAIDTVQQALQRQKDPKTVSILQLALAELEKKSPAEIQDLEAKIAKTEDPVQRDFQLAVDAIGSKNITGAEAFLKDAEKQSPNNHLVWDRLYAFYLSQKQWDQAAPYLDKLSASNDDQAHGLLDQFLMAQAKEDVQAEIAIGKKVTAEYPEFAKSYQCLGEAYQDGKQWRDAVTAFDTAMQKKGLEGDTAALLKSEVECYNNLNEPSRAQMAITEGRRRFPDDIEFRMLQVSFALNTGDSDTAAADLEDLLKARPDLAEVYLVLARAKMAIAEQKVKIPDMPAASAAATRARDVLQQGVNRFPDDTRFYGALADVDVFGSDPGSGEKLLTGLDQRPEWKSKPDAQILLAQFYSKTDQPDKAEAADAEALRRSRNNVQVELLYSKTLVDNKHFDKAIDLLQTVNPSEMHIRRERLQVLMTAGKLADAEEGLKSLLETNPPDAPRLHSVWAQLAIQEGNLDLAGQQISLALAADPHNAAAIALRGNLKMKQSPPDAQGAIADLQTAQQLNPRDVDILASLADVYLYRFDATEAARVLQNALRLEPDNIPLRLRLVYVLSNLEPKRLDQALLVLQDGEARPSGAGNPQLVNAEASINQTMGNAQQALQIVHDALIRNPGNHPLVHTYLDILVSDHQYAPAITGATQFLQASDKDWWAWNDRAQARAAQNDKAGALDDFQQALKLVEADKDVDDAVAVVQTVGKSISADKAAALARQRQGTDPRWDIAAILLLHDAGQDDQAIAILEPLLASKSQTPAQQVDHLLLAGMVYGTAAPTPQVDKAYACYKQLLAINGDNVQALNNLASLCADSFNPPRIQEGLTYSRKAMGLLSSRGATDPIAEDTYGWLLILSGQTGQGMDVLTKAMQKQKFPEGFYHLGEGYLRLNQPDKAQQEVNLALTAISDARQNNQPVSDATRKKIDDLSNRVLDTLRVKTSVSVP